MHRFRNIVAATAVAVAVSLAVLAPVNPPRAEAAGGCKFSAIAYSEQTHQYGYTYGYSCLQDAENDAIANSGAPDAQVVVWVENGWVALAIGDNGAYGDAWSTRSLADAEAMAVQYCAQNGGHCPTLVWAGAT